MTNFYRCTTTKYEVFEAETQGLRFRVRASGDIQWEIGPAEHGPWEPIAHPSYGDMSLVEILTSPKGDFAPAR